jgi:predicted peptidase
MRETILRWGCAAMLLAIVGSCAVAVVGENWSEPEFNRPTNALQLALEILASVEKQFAIDPERIYVVGQSMGGLGVWSLLQTHSEKWAAVVVLAAYDNFTAPMSISRIPCGCFKEMPTEASPWIWCGK